MQAVKTDVVRARISPTLKRSAESVFESLGISPSQAIVLFYKQVEIHRGLPFELKIPEYRLENAAKFSDDRLDAELGRGYASYRSGRARPLSDAHATFRSRHKSFDV